MLELAFLCKDKLNEIWKASIMTGLFRYYFMEPYNRYTLDIPDIDWNVIQYVSKTDAGDIIGFFAAHVNNTHDMIENINIINFTNKLNITFSTDLLGFFELILVQRGFRKAVFRAIADNPASKMYERFILRHKLGHKVGLLTKNRKLEDGRYYDEIIYEVFRTNCANFFGRLKKKPIPNSDIYFPFGGAYESNTCS
jgi:hypothetical protein